MLKRILVTGGAGFLGSHLCDRLVAHGHDVICVDNFFTSQKSNIAHLLDHRNFELVRHDVTEPLVLEVDQIFNLACPAAPGHYQYNPIKTTKTSVLGAINMLGLGEGGEAVVRLPCHTSQMRCVFNMSTLVRALQCAPRCTIYLCGWVRQTTTKHTQCQTL